MQKWLALAVLNSTSGKCSVVAALNRISCSSRRISKVLKDFKDLRGFRESLGSTVRLLSKAGSGLIQTVSSPAYKQRPRDAGLMFLLWTRALNASPVTRQTDEALWDRGKNQLKLRGVQLDEPHIFPIKIKGKKSNPPLGKLGCGWQHCALQDRTGQDGAHRDLPFCSFAFCGSFCKALLTCRWERAAPHRMQQLSRRALHVLTRFGPDCPPEGRDWIPALQSWASCFRHNLATTRNLVYAHSRLFTFYFQIKKIC